MEKIQGIIEGWRIFNISPGTKIREERSLVLRSLVHNKVLAPRRVNEAKHIGWYFDKSKSCPHEGLRCGFNMFRMNKEFNVEVLPHKGAILVKCFGWGKVIPGEKGFRCQYLYPKSIFGYIDSFTVKSIQYLFDSDSSFTKQELWKLVRLYIIQLEFNLPDWITDWIDQQYIPCSTCSKEVWSCSDLPYDVSIEQWNKLYYPSRCSGNKIIKKEI